MKKFRKILLFIMAMAMAISFFSVTAFAEGETMKLTIVPDQADIGPGQTVNLRFYLTDINGNDVVVSGLNFEIDLTTLKNNLTFKPDNSKASITPSGRLKFLHTKLHGMIYGSASEPFMTIEIKVSSNAPVGAVYRIAPPWVKYTAQDTSDTTTYSDVAIVCDGLISVVNAYNVGAVKEMAVGDIGFGATAEEAEAYLNANVKKVPVTSPSGKGDVKVENWKAPADYDPASKTPQTFTADLVVDGKIVTNKNGVKAKAKVTFKSLTDGEIDRDGVPEKISAIVKENGDSYTANEIKSIVEKALGDKIPVKSGDITDIIDIKDVVVGEVNADEIGDTTVVTVVVGGKSEKGYFDIEGIEYQIEFVIIDKYLYGDADGNEIRVEYEDIDAAVNHYLEYKFITDPRLFIQADVAPEYDEIDYNDIDALVNYYLEYISVFPVEEGVLESNRHRATGNYAYVLSARTVTDSDTGMTEIYMQILDKKGSVSEVKFADEVEYVNFDNEKEHLYGLVFTEEAMEDGANKTIFTHKTNELENPSFLVSELTNNVVSYSVNDAGEVDALVVPGSSLKDGVNMPYMSDPKDNQKHTYNKEETAFDGFDNLVNSDTIIFYIKGAEEITYGGENMADKTMSGVGKMDGLESGDYTFVAIDPNEFTGAANAIIVFNVSKPNGTEGENPEEPGTGGPTPGAPGTDDPTTPTPPITYTVSYDANGGSGSMNGATVEEGSEYTLLENTFAAPEGKEFKAWEVNGAEYEAGTVITITADTTIKAVWKDIIINPATYTVSYDANGGSGSMDGATVEEGAEYTLLENTFEAPDGKEFKAWEVNGAEYEAGTVITITADTTIKAVWKDIIINPATYTVSYDANGGAGEMENSTVLEGEIFNLPECAFTAPEGMEFDCWEVDGEKYEISEMIDVTADITAKALWKEKIIIYTITYDMNGGSGVMDEAKITKGEKLTLPECSFEAPEKQEFDGWEIDGVKYEVGAEIDVTDDMTVKALWKEKTIIYTITYDMNGGTGLTSATTTSKEMYTLPSSGFAAPLGMELDGWEVNGVKYVAGSQIFVSEDIVVKAIWKNIIIIPVFTITFDANGGDGIMEDVTVSDGEVYILPECTFDGPAILEFIIWEINGVRYAPGSEITVGGDIVVKAIWL